MLVRVLLTLLIVILTLSASGLSSAIVASTGDDDCCSDGADRKGADEQPGGERDRCPPFCHACACSPAFAAPMLITAGTVVRIPDRQPSPEAPSQLPASPPGQGVFHPPRNAA